MKTLKLALLLVAVSAAQAPPAGTIVQSTNVVATAGTLVCTLSNGSPVLATGVHVSCTNSGTSVLVMDATITVGANGVTGQINQGGNVCSWLVNQPTAGPYSWQMAANGVNKAGTF